MENSYKLMRFLLIISILAGLCLPSIRPVSAEVISQSEIKSVAIAGTLQSELGCASDWMPACEKTFLTLDSNDGIWKGTFEVTPGNDQDKKGPRYKAALNGGWNENYGKNAAQGGSDIPLVVDKTMQVSFYYDPETHWVTENVNSQIIVAFGDFQTQLGCSSDNDPACFRSWLKDPEGSGVYKFITTALKAGTYQIQFSMNGEKQAEPQSFTVAKDGDEIYFGYDAMKKEYTISTTGAPKGNLSKLKAIWVNQDTIMWNVIGSPKYSYALFYTLEPPLNLTADGVQGGNEIPLVFSQGGPGGDVFKKNPYLSGWSAFKVDPKYLDQIPSAIKGQVAIATRNDKGKVIDVTGIQIAGALDALYPYSGSLGASYEKGVPVIRVWAPTARDVKLHLFDDATTKADQVLAMTLDEKTGVWSLAGQTDWTNKYYLFEVMVYVPSTGKVETNLVTDPYSFSLSMNSQRSQIVDLAQADLKPSGWNELKKPALLAPEDAVIYELHVRDFSVNDPSVPDELRGTFKAFTLTDSNGMKHLAELAKAGLTHVHLLPVLDIASINEDKATWKSVDEKALSALPGDSNQQAAEVSKIKGEDGFNWGYDPYHYTVPEGSYSTDPNGPTRIVEFREMVQSLNKTGLRVVMDVVYNHTSESGQSARSVLDKIVPGYYYRLDTEGVIQTSTCCQNTATEHAMMEKLMIDSVVTWAREYKVDGFRFDLMGHHMLTNMVAVRNALDSLTLEKDGVDGKAIYIYGEGWDFGEVAKNARGINATQLNIAGTGIGVFNDRLRDGVRGGNPFSDPREQGFSTSLYFEPNAAEARSPEDQLAKLLEYEDWIRIGLTGNLKDFELQRANGDLVNSSRLSYNGAEAAYTADPQENIIYVSAHDNETIFDAIQVKAAAEVTLPERIRMNNLALSVAMFSQGIPFFHAGDDLLRSKSLDRNSYDSGDWFNRIDWTLTSNNWAAGLPIEGADKWEIFKPLLGNTSLKPSPEDIQFTSAVFQELLSIRKSTPLFRLQTAEQIKQTLSFLNTGKEQIPGLIVMRLSDQRNLDPSYGEVVVFFNAQKDPLTFTDKALSQIKFSLHPIQLNSVDPVVKTAAFDAGSGEFTIPGRSAVVFVAPKEKTVTVATPQPAALPTLEPTSKPEPARQVVSSPTSSPYPVAVSTEQPPATSPSPNSNVTLILACVIATLLVAGGLGWWLSKKRD
ncbi:MAG TPA: pullulanase-type alpha-1,6-glucosidase [Anaerolineaceae bacterium]|nr:pullulanase-type alpha-1,6-glucosidase [Anaerolineaceae bacterium]HPN51693.1 pullulanase-type alpha-1,6-glucosidase [Anaerolineaceae bacterium]